MTKWLLKPPSPGAIAQVRRDIQNGVTYPERWPERKPAKQTNRKSGATSSAPKKGH